MDPLTEDEEGQALQEEDVELVILREQIAMLTKQFYQDRQKWFEEKRLLQESAKLQQALRADEPSQPGARHQGVSSGLLGSETGSETVCENASQLSLSARERSFSSSSCPSSRSASPNQTTGPASISSSAAGAACPSSELHRELADLQRQLEESRRQQESTSLRWTLEREALQRQVHALISMASEASSLSPGGSRALGAAERQDGVGAAATRGSVGHEEEEERLQLTERVSQLEAMVDDLQAERENLEGQLRVVVADVTSARRLATRGGGAAAESAAPSPRSNAAAVAAARESGDGAGTAAAAAGAGFPYGMTLRDSVNVAELLSEKAELERELRRLREDCVAVPRTEFAELSSIRSQMAFLQSEMDAMREEAEAAAAAGLRAVEEEDVEEEVAGQAGRECVSVPQCEYQRLLAVDAEARTRGRAGAAPPSEEEEEAEEEQQRRQLAAAAAQQEHDALVAQVATLQQKLLEAEEAAEATLQQKLLEAEEAAEATLQQKLLEAEEAAEAAKRTATTTGGEAEEEEEVAVGAGAVASGSATAGQEKTMVEEEEARHSEVAVVLREQLAEAVAAATAESNRLEAQVSELQGELQELRSRNSTLVAECGAVRHALASGQVQASGEARAAAAAAEEARSAAVAELRAAQHRIAALEEELAGARSAAEVACADRERLSEEVAAVRDAALRTSAALADCLACRYGQPEEAEEEAEAAEERLPTDGAATGTTTAAVAAPADPAAAAPESMSRVQALEAELAATKNALADSDVRRNAAERAAASTAAASAAVSRELDAARLELAEARELGLLFQSKRDVFQQSKRVIRGLPQEWIYGTAAAAGAAAAAVAAARPAVGSAGDRLTSFATSASASMSGSPVVSTAGEDLAVAVAVGSAEAQGAATPVAAVAAASW